MSEPENGERVVAFLVFDDVEDLDLAGPWQVLATAGLMSKGALRCVTVAAERGPVRCAKGLVILPDHGFADAPTPDILVVPGGRGVDRERTNPELVGWIAATAAGCSWVTSVCSGSILLLEAGPARGKRVTSHWGRIEALRADGRAAAVEDDARYVVDGNLVTSAGVSAGIDMALWLVGRLFEPAFAREVQRRMQYDPAPPYGDDG